MELPKMLAALTSPRAGAMVAAKAGIAAQMIHTNDRMGCLAGLERWKDMESVLYPVSPNEKILSLRRSVPFGLVHRACETIGKGAGLTDAPGVIATHGVARRVH
jgi:hypothetical protein